MSLNSGVPSSSATVAPRASADDVSPESTVLWPRSSDLGLGQGFTSEMMRVNGVDLHCVRGGQGPAVILIHGFPQDWSEYSLILPRLATRFTVVAVDLRGVGGSTPARSGFDAANMAEDVYQLASALCLGSVYVVGHDVGGMVAYAFARRFPHAARGAMILDVALPGLAGWDEIQQHPAMWHVRFMQVPGLAERLVEGRQEQYFGYLLGFGKFDAGDVARYAKAYESPAQLRAAFEMYRAFSENAEFNRAHRESIDVPIFLAAGDGSPFAGVIPQMAGDLRAFGWSRVSTGSIPGSIHYVVEDQPDAVATLIEQHASK